MEELIKKLEETAFSLKGDKVIKRMKNPHGKQAVVLIKEQASVIERLKEALIRIASDYGHCSTCGTLCKNVTDCNCSRPTWESDDWQQTAQAALDKEILIEKEKSDASGS